MTQQKAINYIEQYFEFKVLTKIHGEPTYENLQNLHNQLKTNASSVRSMLGGGAHGHLGLVLSAAEYAAIVPNTPFVKPAHPGILTIAPNTAHHAAVTAKEIHEEALRVFNEVLGVEAALRQQLVAAIDAPYLSAIRNTQSNAINLSVYEILSTHLYPLYGDIDPEKLQLQESTVRAMVYDPVEAPECVYKAIDDLMAMGAAGHSPYSPTQAVNMAYIILSKTGKFETSLREWIRKPQVDKTWVNFKVHFTAAHKELKKLGSIAINNTATFQQANVIQQMVAHAMQDVLDQHMQEMQCQEVPSKEENVVPPPVQQANAALQTNSEDPVLPLIMQQMKSMQEMMQMMQNNMNNMQNTNNFNSNNNNYNRNKGNGGRQERKYCWTHGYCFHSGKECTRKAQGHKDNATVNNRMNGSTRGCNKANNGK